MSIQICYGVIILLSRSICNVMTCVVMSYKLQYYLICAQFHEKNGVFLQLGGWKSNYFFKNKYCENTVPLFVEWKLIILLCVIVFILCGTFDWFDIVCKVKISVVAPNRSAWRFISFGFLFLTINPHYSHSYTFEILIRNAILMGFFSTWLHSFRWTQTKYKTWFCPSVVLETRM